MEGNTLIVSQWSNNGKTILIKKQKSKTFMFISKIAGGIITSNAISFQSRFRHDFHAMRLSFLCASSS